MQAAESKKAADIVLLDVRGICSFADCFVICSGESEKQLEAIHEEVEGVLKKEKVQPLHCEGTAKSGWLLLDFGDVIIHIFAPFERELYQLDKLWSQAHPVVRIQ